MPAKKKAGAKKRAIKHVGFKGAMAKVQAQGKSPAAAARIIGASNANASAAAKKANPRLLKKGGAKKRAAKKGGSRKR